FPRTPEGSGVPRRMAKDMRFRFQTFAPLRAAVPLAFILLAGAAFPARAEGPVTSRLATAKFALMRGWWGNDHDATTPVTFTYIAQLAVAHGVQVDTVTLGTLIDGN